MPKAVGRRYIAHHECDIRLRRMATTPTFYPYSPEPHRGIAQSAPVALDVIKLAIDAEEGRAWFFETHACERLRELFPAAITFLIEDDYRSTN
jgi:hypothetical protein